MFSDNRFTETLGFATKIRFCAKWKFKNFLLEGNRLWVFGGKIYWTDGFEYLVFFFLWYLVFGGLCVRRRSGIGRSLGREEREREWQEKGGDGAGVCDIFLELTRGTLTAARFQISGYHVPIWEP